MTYNRDLQEDKEPLFDIVNTVKNCIEIYIKMFPLLSINKENMLMACKKGFLNATDAADYLVRKGLSFREAHEIVGQLVQYSIENECILDEIPLEKYKKFSNFFDKDIYSVISVKNCIKMRASYGGTSFNNVKRTILREKKKMKG